MSRCDLQLLLWWLLFAQLNSAHKLLSSATTDEPAMKFHITEKGLAYIFNEIVKEVNEQIPNSRIERAYKDLGKRGTVELYDLEVTEYRAPTRNSIALREPNMSYWTVRNGHVSLRSKLGGTINVFGSRIPLNGTLKASLTDMDFDVSNRFLRVRRDELHVDMIECKTKIRKMQMQVEDGGIVSRALRDPGTKTAVENEVKAVLESDMCELIHEHIVQQFNQLIRSYPSKMSLRDIEQVDVAKRLQQVGALDPNVQARIISGLSRVRSASKPKRKKRPRKQYLDRHGVPADFDVNEVLNDGVEKIRNFQLDYRLVTDPHVKNYYIELLSRGEVSNQGAGYTKIAQPPLPSTRPLSSDMFGILISDYVLNSALYHAFKSHYLCAEVQPTTSGFGRFMHTTCSNGGSLAFCLGDALPVLQEQYPEHYLKLRAFPTRAPEIRFTPDQGARLDLNYMIYVYASPRDFSTIRQILVINVDMKAGGDMELVQDGDEVLLTGLVNFDSVKFDVRKSLVDSIATGDQLSNLADWLKIFLDEIINEVLADGHQLPTLAGMHYSNIRMRMLHRAVYIQGDIDLDETYLQQMVVNMMQRIEKSVMMQPD